MSRRQRLSQSVRVLALVTVCVGLLPQGASASAEPALQSIAYEAVVPAYGHDAKVVREHGIPGIRRGSSIQNGAASSGGRVLTPAAFDKDAFSNDVAGFGDDLTFGATSWARRTINEKYLGGCGDVIDASSTAHTAGGALGFTAGLAVPTGYLGRAFGQVSKLLAGSKAGRAANTGTARFVAASDGVVTDLVGSRNAISIGHYPEYVANAQATGARTFSMADDAWNAMSPTEQWVRNQRFQLATPLSQVRAGSFLEREIGYLSGRGYVPNVSGTLMIPGGG